MYVYYLPPAVDYPSTTSYYWPDIAQNVTQVDLP